MILALQPWLPPLLTGQNSTIERTAWLWNHANQPITAGISPVNDVDIAFKRRWKVWLVTRLNDAVAILCLQFNQRPFLGQTLIQSQQSDRCHPTPMTLSRVHPHPVWRDLERDQPHCDVYLRIMLIEADNQAPRCPVIMTYPDHLKHCWDSVLILLCLASFIFQSSYLYRGWSFVLEIIPNC